MIAKTVKAISVVFILACIIAAGFYLRVSNPDSSAAKVYNVNAYYFYKSQYLNDHGRLPEKDIWSFAPEAFPENVPPLLAYGTVGAFKLAKLFKPDIDFYGLAMFFPVIVYVLWAFFGFWLVIRLFDSRICGFIFVGLLAVAPLSFDLTVYGHYTEESLGAFLFFLALVFLIKFIESKKRVFFWLAVFSLTAFYLVWQQFPLFFAGLFFIGLIEILKEQAGRRRLLFHFMLLAVLPLIFGHLISCCLLGTAYSPVSMIYEAWLGAKDMNSDFIRTAMFRQDWRNLYLDEFIALISLAGWILIGGGFLKSILCRKEPKYKVILIFSVLTLAIAVKFFKSRYLALPSFLLIASSAGELFFNKNQKDWQELAGFFRPPRAFFARLSSRTKQIFYPAVLILLILLLFFCSCLLFRKKERKLFPLPTIAVSSSLENFGAGGAYKIEMKLANRGGDSFSDPVAFGGLHVEVENAEVENIVSWTDHGESQVVIKPDAQRENIYWFEVKCSGLKSAEAAYAWFKIIPKVGPVSIYYRGWLPAEPTFWQRLKTMINLAPEYRNWRNSWRSEDAIRRNPANDDVSREFCPVRVFAAHENLQDFRCFKIPVK